MALSEEYRKLVTTSLRRTCRHLQQMKGSNLLRKLTSLSSLTMTKKRRHFYSGPIRANLCYYTNTMDKKSASNCLEIYFKIEKLLLFWLCIITEVWAIKSSSASLHMARPVFTRRAPIPRFFPAVSWFASTRPAFILMTLSSDLPMLDSCFGHILPQAKAALSLWVFCVIALKLCKTILPSKN